MSTTSPPSVIRKPLVVKAAEIATSIMLQIHKDSNVDLLSPAAGQENQPI
jgi:hypothetical protein